MTENENKNIDEKLKQILDTDSNLKQLFGCNLNEEKHPLSIYNTIASELALHFDEKAIFKIFDEYLSSEYWSELDEGQRKTRLSKIIKNAKNQPTKLNVEVIKEKLKTVELKQDLTERVKQATEFVTAEILPTNGTVGEIEALIDAVICPKFRLLSAKEKKYLTNNLKSGIKAKKHQSKTVEMSAKEIDCSDLECSDYYIDPEFNGLYEASINKISGAVTITPYCDKIAERVAQNFKVFSYKDLLYAFDNNLRYYTEASHPVTAEAVRILKGILHDAKGNSIVSNTRAVMEYIMHINRLNEYPFTNAAKIIPVQNGVLKIDSETGGIELLDHDPDKYILNYTFPVEYNPEVQTGPVLEMLKKYTATPDLIIQMIAQIIAQTVTEQPFKKGYALYGQPDYGKTFIGVELIEKKILGGNLVSKIPLNRLSEDSENRFVTASLEGKLANIKDDMGYFNMKDAGTFKDVTGSFNIRVEHKGKDDYVGKSTAVYIFITNRLPSYADAVRDDDAFWIRMQPIEFNVTKFKRNATAAADILTTEFLSGLLNLALKQVVKMLQTRKLPYEDEWETVREEWSRSSEPVYRFILENMEPAKNTHEWTYALKKDFLRAVQDWYDDTFSSIKGRPTEVTHLTNAIKLAGGILDADRGFEFRCYDEYGHPETESCGNFSIEKTETKRMKCYGLPWKFKAGVKYSGRIRSCIQSTRDEEITQYT